MNVPILIATILTLLAFVAHTFLGDRELKLIEPKPENDEKYVKQEKWTMARSGWHLISFDLLFAAVGLTLINFTDYFDITFKKLLLEIMTIYFLGYGVAWLIGIMISRRFPKKYLKLGQWLLLWVISGLIYLGLEMIKFKETRFSPENLYSVL